MRRMSARCLCGGWNYPYLRGSRRMYLLGSRSDDRRRLDSLDFQFLILQRLHEACDRSDALGHLCFARCAKLVISKGLKLLRSFAEHMFHTFAELQFGFALGGVAIGESVLAEIVDCGEDLLKSDGPGFNFFERDRFGQGLRIVCCVCACHSVVKKV